MISVRNNKYKQAVVLDREGIEVLAKAIPVLLQMSKSATHNGEALINVLAELDIQLRWQNAIDHYEIKVRPSQFI